MIIGCRYLGAIVFGLGMGWQFGFKGILISFGALILMLSMLPSNQSTGDLK